MPKVLLMKGATPMKQNQGTNADQKKLKFVEHKYWQFY